jgi:hypothetical protein
MGVRMVLDPDFNEFLRLFLAHEVRFLIVGGYAVAAHGLPRATGDLDAWILVDEQNAAKVLAALDDFGFGSLELSLSDFSRPDSIVQLGYPPHRVDIMTEVDGLTFEAAWERRVTITIDAMSIPFIGRDDLIANKRAAGRPQDLADVARLSAGGEGGPTG